MADQPMARNLLAHLPVDDFGIRQTASTATQIWFPADGHDRTNVLDDGPWYRHRNDCIRALVQRSNIDGAFLDVGGGNGAVAAALTEMIESVVLIEPGRRGAENGRRRGLEDVVHGTLEGAELPPDSAGAAGAFDVLEHLVDPIALLQELARVVRPDGRLLVTVPAHNWLWANDDDFAGHQRRYSRASLERELRGGGWTIEWATYFFSALVPGIALLRSLPSRLGRGPDLQDLDRYTGEDRLLDLRIVKAAWRWELSRIRSGRAIPVGASVLAVARHRNAGTPDARI